MLQETEGNYDVTNDYPRAYVEDYRQDIETQKRKPATVVTARFQLDRKEITEIESEFGSGVLVKPEFIYSKGYENHRSFSLSIKEDAGIRSIIEKAELPVRLSTSLSKATGL